MKLPFRVMITHKHLENILRDLDRRELLKLPYALRKLVSGFNYSRDQKFTEHHKKKLNLLVTNRVVYYDKHRSRWEFNRSYLRKKGVTEYY